MDKPNLEASQTQNQKFCPLLQQNPIDDALEIGKPNLETVGDLESQNIEVSSASNTAETIHTFTVDEISSNQKSQKNFQCCTCMKEFATKQRLNGHIRGLVCHKEKKVNKCDLCNREFDRPVRLRLHKMMVHKVGDERVIG